MNLSTETVAIAAAIMGGIYALYLFGLPLAVLALFRKPMEPGLSLFDPTRGSMPEEAAEVLARRGRELAALGFSPVCYLRMDPELEQMDAYAEIHANVQARDLAMVLACEAPSRFEHVEFCAEFDDGTELCTNNSPEMPLEAVQADTKSVYWYPDREDTAALYDAHSALCGGLARSPKKALPDPDTIFAEVIRGMKQDYGQAVRNGMFREDELDESYRMTFAGAYRLSRPQLFPFNHILRGRRQRSDQAALQRVGGR